MKNILKVLGIIAIVAVIGFSMAACGDKETGDPTGPGGDPGTNQTPVASDYTIGNLNQTAGSVTAVTITPKAGKSTGARTIYYEGTGSTTYTKSTTIPQAVGTYAVTFDVAAAAGWNAATNLSAGTLTVNLLFTSIADFATWLAAQPPNTAATFYTVALIIDDLGGDADTVGSLGAVLFANNTKYVSLDLSGSTITEIPDYAFEAFTPSATPCVMLTGIIIPEGVAIIGNESFRGSSLTSITIPDSVTLIDFGAFNGCTSLSSVVIGNGGAVIGNRSFSGCTSLTSVAFRGTIPAANFISTAFYNLGDLRDKFYADDPTNGTPGTYTTTAPVNSSSVWIKSGGNQAPVAGDYTIGNLNQIAGSVTAVTITPKSGRSTGAVSNIKYAGSLTIPQSAGTYAVTFDVAPATGWNAATNLSAGTLIVTAAPLQTPTAADYDIGNLSQTAGSVTAVTITPQAGKSPGAVTIYYAGTGATTYAKSTTIPQAVGTYAVTFDVAGATGWNAATGLIAGTLMVTPPENNVTGANLQEKLTWLRTNATSNTAYRVTVDQNESLAGTTASGSNYNNLSYSGRTNVSIRLIGTGSERIVSLSSNGRLFQVGNGVTLILDNNITLQGRSANNAPVVGVVTGGTLVMNNGSKITGNTNTTSSAEGGAVFIEGGTFNMTGGEISGNSLTTSTTTYGGGVCVDRDFTIPGTFNMSGSARISGNTAYYGGGVYVSTDSIFTLSGSAVISGNNSIRSGGGVYQQGTFTMTGGEISNNTCGGDGDGGGGVYARGTFTMTGGEISGNISFNYGGGVLVPNYGSSSFTKTGGTITGYNASTEPNGNVTKYKSDGTPSNSGNAVYVDKGGSKRRNTTAGPEVNLNSDTADNWES